MRTTSKALFFLIVVFGAAMNNYASAKGTEMASKAECINSWNEIVSPLKGLNVTQQRERWEKQKVRCEATGVYDFGMGKIYLQGGQFKEARAAALRAMKVADLAVREEAELIVADALFMELTSKKEALSDKEWQTIKAGYESLVKKYPDSYSGYNGLAAVALARQDYPNTIRLSRLANEKYPTAKAYRKLVISYMQMSQYQDSISAGGKAIEIDRKALGDRDMMLALAVSHIQLHQYDSAKSALDTLLRHHPAVKHDKGFRDTAGYLRQEMDKAALPK